MTDPTQNEPPAKRGRGRPPGSKPKAGGRRKRAFMNKAIFVDQTGAQTPVVRLLLTLPVGTTRKLDDLAALMGVSASGAVACLIDELPTPHLLEPAPSFIPPLPDEASGLWRPLWLPTALGGKLARYLARTGHTLNQFVGGIVAAMPEPDLVAGPRKAFAGWADYAKKQSPF
jgi:hypothetical protein